MKTDRELLKLAANAAGMQWIDDSETGLTIQRAEGNGIYNFHWNPLFNDGDALRLAVKLQLTIANEHVQAGSAYCLRGDEIFPDEFCQESGSAEVLPSDYAATRRAIVRAAAAIAQASAPAGDTKGAP